MKCSRQVSALALVLLVVGLGCGSDSKEESNGVESKAPEQILDATIAALRKVKTFHIESTEATSGRVSADVGLPDKLRFRLKEGAVSGTLLVVRGSFYMNGNAAFWKDADAAREADELADRWLKVPFSLVEDLTKGLDRKTFGDCLLGGHGTLTRGGFARVGGKRAFVLLDRGDRPGSAAGKLYVAATGDPLPLRLIVTTGEHPGGRKDPACGDDTPAEAGDELIFSAYDEPIDVRVPPAALNLAGGTSS